MLRRHTTNCHSDLEVHSLKPNANPSKTSGCEIDRIFVYLNE